MTAPTTTGRAAPPVAALPVPDPGGLTHRRDAAGLALGSTSPAAPLPLVLGLDLSIAATGVAACDGETFTIATKAKGDARLLEIETFLLNHIITAEFAVLEDLPFHAKAAGISGMVQGVVRKLLVETGTDYCTVVASSLKKYATGNGAADKHLMRMEAYKRAGVEFADDNQCDAWWLRLMGLDLLGHPVLELPKVNRASLDKVKRAVVA